MNPWNSLKLLLLQYHVDIDHVLIMWHVPGDFPGVFPAPHWHHSMKSQPRCWSVPFSNAARATAHSRPCQPSQTGDWGPPSDPIDTVDDLPMKMPDLSWIMMLNWQGLTNMTSMTSEYMEIWVTEIGNGDHSLLSTQVSNMFKWIASMVWKSKSGLEDIPDCGVSKWDD